MLRLHKFGHAFIFAVFIMTSQSKLVTCFREFDYQSPITIKQLKRGGFEVYRDNRSLGRFSANYWWYRDISADDLFYKTDNKEKNALHLEAVERAFNLSHPMFKGTEKELLKAEIEEELGPTPIVTPSNY